MIHEEFLKRYQYNPVTDRLGEGGTGNVFKAYDAHRDCWVALKISKVNPTNKNVRLKRELETAAQLPSNPNIACYDECYTFTSFDGEYDFGILQYYEQGNLLQLLKQGLSSARKQNILAQILSGIEFLHSHDIVHGNLKPQNILIVKRGEEYIPKITGFGNRIAGGEIPAYSSPEQLSERAISKNADLWSFGVIAYQTLTGTLPFTTGEYAETGEAGRLELFRQINSGQLPVAINSIAEPWQRLIRTCLVPDPEERVKNCEECNAILKGEMQADTKQENSRQETVHWETWKETPKLLAKKPKPKPVKRILLGIAGGVTGLLLVLFIGGILSAPGEEDLKKFEDYKEAAFKNYQNAQNGDTEFYDIALKYCNDALSIKKDEELEDLKKEIKKMKKNK
jgi:serine/threonine protein kinase